MVKFCSRRRSNNDSHYHRAARPLSPKMRPSKNFSSAEKFPFRSAVIVPLPSLSSPHFHAANSFSIRPSVRSSKSGWPTFRRQSGVTRIEAGRRFDPHHRRTEETELSGQARIGSDRRKLKSKSMSPAFCSNFNAKGQRARDRRRITQRGRYEGGLPQVAAIR